jgi:hypothetical protein
MLQRYTTSKTFHFNFIVTLPCKTSEKVYSMVNLNVIEQ